MVKYFVPIDFPQITPPFEKMRSLGNRQLAVARTKFRHLSSEVRAVVLMVRRRKRSLRQNQMNGWRFSSQRRSSTTMPASISVQTPL
ncbi:hypothetical protein LB505_011209 [Fusarium chuoi]|nr:hypothetical protein LB505_011209 [Fusarium chuoi]